ncbi:unnamed protein product [Acanthosepion pharaonis]|uniref:Uncharacterized protein n=1 Tax=Acanthosepion pharaonis TaxID=158019 RepID=A0A812CSC3_ACAPH|nr:unnamed protein product [Sepia pharaonis]
MSRTSVRGIPSYYLFTKRRSRLAPPVRGIPSYYLFTKDDHTIMSHLPSEEFPSYYLFKRRSCLPPVCGIPSYYLFKKTIMSRTSRPRNSFLLLVQKDDHVSHLRLWNSFLLFVHKKTIMSLAPPSGEFPSYYFVHKKDDHVSHLRPRNSLPITCSQKTIMSRTSRLWNSFLLLVHKRRSCLAPPVRGIPFLLLVHKRRSCLLSVIPSYLVHKNEFLPVDYLFTKTIMSPFLPSVEFPSYYLFTKTIMSRTSRPRNSLPITCSQKTIMSDHVCGIPVLFTKTNSRPSFLLLVHKRRSCLLRLWNSLPITCSQKTRSRKFPSYYLFTKDDHVSPPVCGIPSYYLFTKDDHVSHLPSENSFLLLVHKRRSCRSWNSFLLLVHKRRSCPVSNPEFPSYYLFTKRRSCLAPPVRGIPSYYLFTKTIMSAPLPSCLWNSFLLLVHKDDHVSHLPSEEFPSYYLFTKDDHVSHLRLWNSFLDHVSHLPSEEFPSYYLFTKDDHVSHLPVRGIPFLLLVHKRRSCLAPPVRGIPSYYCSQRRSCLAPPICGIPFLSVPKDDSFPSEEFLPFTKRRSCLAPPSVEFLPITCSKDDHVSHLRPRNSFPITCSQKTIMSRTSRLWNSFLLLVHKRRSCLAPPVRRNSFLLLVQKTIMSRTSRLWNSFPITCSQRRSCLAPPSEEFPSYYLFKKTIMSSVCGIPPVCRNSFPYYLFTKRRSCLTLPSEEFLPITCSQKDDHVSHLRPRNSFLYLFTKDDHVSHLRLWNSFLLLVHKKTIMSRTSRLWNSLPITCSQKRRSCLSRLREFLPCSQKTIMSRTSRPGIPSYYLFTKDDHVSRTSRLWNSFLLLVHKDDHVSHLPSGEFLPITCSQKTIMSRTSRLRNSFVLLVHKDDHVSHLRPRNSFLLLVHKRRSCLAPPVLEFLRITCSQKTIMSRTSRPGNSLPITCSEKTIMSRTSRPWNSPSPYYLFTKRRSCLAPPVRGIPFVLLVHKKTIMSLAPPVCGIPFLLLVHKRRSCLAPPVRGIPSSKRRSCLAPPVRGIPSYYLFTKTIMSLAPPSGEFLPITYDHVSHLPRLWNSFPSEEFYYLFTKTIMSLAPPVRGIPSYYLFTKKTIMSRTSHDHVSHLRPRNSLRITCSQKTIMSRTSRPRNSLPITCSQRRSCLAPPRPFVLFVHKRRSCLASPGIPSYYLFTKNSPVPITCSQKTIMSRTSRPRNSLRITCSQKTIMSRTSRPRNSFLLLVHKDDHVSHLPVRGIPPILFTKGIPSYYFLLLVHKDDHVSHLPSEEFLRITCSQKTIMSRTSRPRNSFVLLVHKRRSCLTSRPRNSFLLLVHKRDDHVSFTSCPSGIPFLLLVHKRRSCLAPPV